MKKNEFEYIYNYRSFSILRIVSPPGSGIIDFTPPHIHNLGELIIAESGHSVFTSDGYTETVEGNYIIYAPQLCIHGQVNDKNTLYSRYCLAIDRTMVDECDWTLPDKPFAINVDRERFDVINGYASILDSFFDDKQGELSTLARKRLRHLLSLLFCEIGEILREQKLVTLRPTTNIGYIGDICTYIGEHFDEPLSIDLLAELAYISRSKLTRDFRSVLDMSVVDYITAVRVDRSMPMLAEGISVAEIARRCGFSSSSYYIRCFRALKGMTPYSLIRKK